MTDTLPHEWVKIHARANPEAPAVVFADISISYAELDLRADAYALSLVDEGFEAGDLVPFEATQNLETVIALVAIPRIRAVPVPYGPHVIEASDTLREPAYAVVPTSGSSGRPRGVILTPGNVNAAVAASERRLGNDRGDRWLLTLPLFHVGGLSVVWRSLTTGGSIELHTGFDAARTAESLRSGSVSMVSLVPTMLHRILDIDPGPYAGIKGVLLGGAPANRDLVERGLGAGLPVLQTYGMTETCSQVTTVEPGTARRSLGTAGRPLDGFSVTIDGGEIVIDGPAVSPGYLGESPRIGPYRTGDLGHMDRVGRLIVTGRKDELILTGGENVRPSAIEEAIEAIPAVSHAVVVGIDDEEWGTIVVAIVETEPDAIVDVKATVAGRLARHEIPKHWIAVEQLPLLPNGKPDRASARDLAAREIR
ncbi:MAG: AMP-binding protein [Actinomycetota bacterium]|nr:AMP-binding protein [Actinomycetota bacterium]